jgi:myo-inositol 2-dehydrogenase/D-chiro-inositol 1-dehydrogenase
MNDRTTGSRREFLRNAAIGLSWLPASAGYVGGSDVIRVGLIGCGGRGEAAALNAMNADKGVQLVAMADLLMDRVQEKRTALRLKKPDQVQVTDDRCFAGFDAYRRVIECSDVVIIANAAKFHPLHMKAAIEAGKHVFVEKPHAIDPAGVKVVAEACELAVARSSAWSRFAKAVTTRLYRDRAGASTRAPSARSSPSRKTSCAPPMSCIPRRPGLTEVEYQASNQYHFHWLSGDRRPAIPHP